MITVLLFYKYVSLTDPHAIQAWQRAIGKAHNLVGRILIAEEGINATVAGSRTAIKAYVKDLKSYPLFKDIDIKYSTCDMLPFPKLSVKVRHEVVTLGIDPTVAPPSNPEETHLSPDKAHALLEQQPEELVILDARNNYESRIGRFKGAIAPDITSFKEFPDYVEKHKELFEGKKVLMYCTGGIRCERASTVVQSKTNAKKVYQITGGIVRYTEQYPEGFFRGKNYVFDDRIALAVNDDVLTTCDLCQVSCDWYTNCINAHCNKQFISCDQCREAYEWCCSQACCDAITSGKAPRRKDKVGAQPYPKQKPGIHRL